MNLDDLLTRVKVTDRKIVILDIERAQGEAVVPFWDLGAYKGRRIPAQYVTKWPRTICAAWKIYGEDDVHTVNEWDQNHYVMLERLWRVFDSADIIVGHNVDRFDIKHLNSEWLENGFTPPSPYKIVDTYTVAKAHFGMESKSLDAMCKRLGIPNKTDSYSVDLANLATSGDRQAQKQLLDYNIGDIHASEALWLALLPWIHNHPVVMIDDGEHPRCNRCGSSDIRFTGRKTTAVVLEYDLWQCNNCGGWMRSGWNTGRRTKSRGVK